MPLDSIKYVFAAVVLVVFLTPTAKACSCMDSGPPCQAYWPASAVFTGQVIQVTTFTRDQDLRGYPQKLVRFAVSQTFRGVSGITVETITGNGGGDCGYPFKVGQSYLVYAYGDQKTDKLHASICSRTRLLSEASEDLEYLQNLSRGQGGGTILGSVGSSRIVKSGYQPPRPLPNVRITVEGSRGSLDVLTDDKGEYRLAGLFPGTYKVRITPPEGLWAGEEERKVEIQDRGCAFVRFGLLPRTSLSGKVLDENGEPASKMRVDLVPSNQIGERNQNHNLSIQTDDNGRFEFNAIPQGEYFLGIRLNRLAGLTFPYPRVFYPSTQDLSKAAAIAISDGMSLEGYDIQLPEKLKNRIIEGVVLWPDGRGVSNARLCVEEVEHVEGSSCNSDGLKVGEDGSFSFSGLEGLRYLVRAHVSGVGDSGSEQRHAEPVEVPAKGSVGGLKLVITEPNGTCAKCWSWRRKND